MSYNLVLDTLFKNKEKNWNFINCVYEDGCLISNNKIFGVEQDLVLPDPTKLYFRFTYNILNSDIKDIKIGIQNKDILNISRKFPRKNKNQIISIVEFAKQEKIKIHLIFESHCDINKVKIKEPLLVDLESINKTSWLKWNLDRKLFFDRGYSYKNIYKESEITPNNSDFQYIIRLEKAKIGCVSDIKYDSNIKLECELQPDKIYLFKLDYKESNKFGKIDIKYGGYNGVKIGEEQLILLFKANNKDTLKLILTPTDIISYKINLKHILILDTTDIQLDKEDIKYLPFI